MFKAKPSRCLTRRSLGRLIRSAARPAVHLVRRVLHPRVPPQLQLTRLSCNGQRTAILHRRTFCGLLSDSTVFRGSPVRSSSMCALRHDRQLSTNRFWPRPSASHRGLRLQYRRKRFVVRLRVIRAHMFLLSNLRQTTSRASAAELWSTFDVDLRLAGVASEDGFASDHRSRRREARLPHSSCRPWRAVSETFSLPTLLKSKSPLNFTPFLLKLDIEGAEKPLFDGDCSTIATFSIIIMEPHDWSLFPGQRDVARFFAFTRRPDASFLFSTKTSSPSTAPQWTPFGSEHIHRTAKSLQH